MFETLYNDIKHKNLKQRKAKVMTKYLPWMNSEIRKLMNKRYKQLLKAQKTKQPNDRRKFKELRNNVNKALRKAGAEYWNKTLNKAEKGSSE